MRDPLLAGLLAGWGVAIPLGAIGVMIVDLGARAGFRPAAAAAAGVATADFVYATVAAAAGAAVAGALAPHEHALRLAAAAVLAVVALLGLRMARRGAAPAAPTAPTAAQPAAHPAARPAAQPAAHRSARPAAHPAAPPAARRTGRGIFLRFLALTSINPLTVAYFAALIAGLPAVASAPAGAKAVFVLAVGAASLSWQLVLAGAGAALHHRLPSSARLYTALAGNAIVLALAARMAVAA
jgi:threonine/homoserine/homoserine lactone efflux protein